MGNKAKRLGELLVKKGVLTPTQLNIALERQRSTREFLGAILMRLGWLTEEALLKTLAEQFVIPYVRQEDEAIDWNAAKRFSSALLMDHHCFPLRMDGQTVTVAIANPLDVWAISELEKKAGFRKIQLVLMSTQEILALLKEFQRRGEGLLSQMKEEHP